MLAFFASPRRSMRTKPSLRAYRVGSAPSPTFSPGRKRVPRCRTRMLPAVTNWPPKRLTPSICGLESRPFRELPTPFLCAMRLDLDLGNAYRAQDLTMPAVASIVLSPLELDDQDLGALLLGDDLARHASGGQRLGIDRDLAVLVHEEHPVELDRASLRLAETLHRDHLPRGHPVLLSARSDHCFHVALT